MSICPEDIKQLFVLQEFTNKFVLIKRQILNKDNTQENDAQHSFQLCIVAWFIINKHKLKLNLEKVFKYALAHDLVETYAGDVDAYTQTKKVKLKKQKAEEKAFKQITKELECFPEILKIIQTYEKKQDKESKFVYAIDKIIPIINIEINNDNYYLRNKTEKEVYLRHKNRDKDHKLVGSYFKVLTEYLDYKGDYFYPGCKNRDFSNKDYNFEYLNKFN